MKETGVGCPKRGGSDHPEYAECRRCQVDVSGPFGSRNIPEAFWEIRQRPALPEAGQGER